MRPIRQIALIATLIAGGFSPGLAQAKVERANADSFLVVEHAEVTASASRAFAAFGQIGGWWNPVHTYSAKADALHLALTAGGCFCESWPDGEAEHARVLLVIKDKHIRLLGSLGPLQSLAVTGVLDFTITSAADGGKTALTLSYLVNGSSASQLDKIAPAVDSVIDDALQRLARILDGAPL